MNWFLVSMVVEIVEEREMHMKSNKWSRLAKVATLAAAVGGTMGLAGNALAIDPVRLTMGPWENPWPFNYSKTETLTNPANQNVATVKIITGNAYRATYSARPVAGNTTRKFKGNFDHYCVLQSPPQHPVASGVVGDEKTLECVNAWLGADLLIEARANIDND